jgi:hypothetical protein
MAVLRARLSHIYWIGGGSGAGKSTIARRLAARHGLRVYATDEVMSEHARRSTPQDAPFLSRFMGADMDERWVNRPPEAMLDTFHWFRGEGFGLAEQDRSLWNTRLIAEGVDVLQTALTRDRLGEFQAQAAIAALHADARTAEETDWVQIVEWYDELVRLTDSGGLSNRSRGCCNGPRPPAGDTPSPHVATPPSGQGYDHSSNGSSISSPSRKAGSSAGNLPG